MFQPRTETLHSRLQTLLPDQYQAPDQNIQPTPMGSTPLLFAPDGTVAWDQIWASFCDLAMAGGPPHRGTLLLPATPAEAAGDPARYTQVTAELCRGISLVSGLQAAPARAPGWIRIECPSSTMAGWLTRAITMENVSAACEDAILYLPAAPAFRLEREIKNVITVLAKTTHYWRDHTLPDRQQQIARVFGEMSAESPLLQPPLTPAPAPDHQAAHAIAEATALPVHQDTNSNWLGIRYPTVPAAIWLMQRFLASNILARREQTTLFLPLNPTTDPAARHLIATVTKLQALAHAEHQL